MQNLTRLTPAIQSLNAFVSLPAEIRHIGAVQTNGALKDLVVAIKDNICTREFPTTCASRGLKPYNSAHDATVISLLREGGATIAGKTNLDEFGMGSHSVHSAFGAVRNIDGRSSAGGSSGGSAVAVASGQCHAALGTDTGGSVRLPAAYNGIYGLKPSYGMLSRWGVVAYANSLDTVGVFARDCNTLRRMRKHLSQYDYRDPTSVSQNTREALKKLIGERSHGRHHLVFGIPQEYNIQEMSTIVREAWGQVINKLRSLGHEVHEVSIPTTRQALSAYYVLAPAEAASNLAKYDGVRYGTTAPNPTNPVLYSDTRREGFGDEVRRRILLGSFSLSAEAIENYFIQAQKVRRLLQRDFDSIFRLANIASGAAENSGRNNIDALICPTAPGLPPSLEEVENLAPLDAYTSDVFTVPASLAGLPAVSAPVDCNGRTVGMQIIAQYGDDELAIDIAEMLE